MLFKGVISQMQEPSCRKRRNKMGTGFWANFGELVLLAILLGAVTTVVDSVLGVVGLSKTIKSIPIIGSNWTLIISVLMMALIMSSVADYNALDYWGINLGTNWSGWMNYVANGAIVMGMVPVKDAVVSMIGKGLRA